MRSTSRTASAAAGVKMELDDDVDIKACADRGRSAKARKTSTVQDVTEDVKPFTVAEPTTPKKAGRTNAAAGSSKDVLATPPKKQGSSAPVTPSRSGEPASVSTLAPTVQKWLCRKDTDVPHCLWLLLILGW